MGMELKQKVKKQDVQRLRQLIQAVADKNGEGAKLPISFLPFRGIIMVISLAGLAYGVVATFIVTISTIFFTELTMQQPGEGYQNGLTNSMFLDWLIMFAFVAIVSIVATNPFTGNGTSWLFAEMKKWRRGKPLQRNLAAEPLKY